MTTIPNAYLAPRSPERSYPIGSTPLSLRDILNIIFYYRRKALFIFLSIVLLGIVVIFLLPPTYTARARLLTLNGVVYELQAGSTALAHATNPTIAVDIEMQLLESSELHRKLIRRQLGTEASPLQIEKQVNAFESHLHVSKLEAGNVIEVTYRDRDPQAASAALRSLLDTYFQERADVLTSGRVGFLTAQRDKVQSQLDEANAQIEAFEKEHGVVNIGAQIDNAVQLDGNLRERDVEAHSNVADTARRLDTLKGAAKDVPKEVELYSDNSEAAHTIGTMQSQLFQLQAKRADLAARYMETSPFVKQVDDQIASLSAAIDKQKSEVTVARRTGYNNYHDTVTDRLAQAEASNAGAVALSSVLDQQVSQSQQHLKDLISVSGILARLTMQRDILGAAVKDYATQLEQARVEQNQANTAGTTNVRIIEAPVPPNTRSNPPLLMLAATFVAALAITGVAIIILSSLRETFLSPQEAERALHLPVLCYLGPREGSNMPSRFDFGHLIAAADSVSPETSGKVILLLSSQSETQMSSIAQTLITALEQRAPGRVIHTEIDPLASPADRFLPFHPNEEAKVSISMAMTRARLTSLFRNLRSSYDYVVVTAPPASTHFETLELTTVADLSVLVVQAENTRKVVAQSVISQAAYINGNIAGLLMTGRRYYIPSWVYRLFLHGRGFAS